MHFCFAYPIPIIMTKLWKCLLSPCGILCLLTIDLCVDYEEMGKKVLEVVRDQKLANCVFLTPLEDSGLCTTGGESPYGDLERGVLVTVLFLIFLGSLYSVNPIFFDIWEITKDERVKFSELFEFLRVS